VADTDLFSYRRDRAFLSSPTATVVLDRDMVIKAANRAYQEATSRTEADLVSQPLLDAFPANPDDPDSGVSAKNLIRSFEETLRRNRPHHLMLLRYDILDAAREQYLTRFWVPVCRPLVRAGEIVGVSWEVDCVPAPEPEAVAAIEQARDLILGDDAIAEEAAGRLSTALTVALRGNAALAREAAQLREALETRTVIEQAKGLVMARDRCTPDEAFAVLRQLSQRNHVRLADVARALVYQAAEQD